MRLMELYPNYTNIDASGYEYDWCLYYPIHGEIRWCDGESAVGRMIVAFGKELQPVPKEELSCCRLCPNRKTDDKTDIKRLMQQAADEAMEACKSIKKLCRQI